MTLLDAREHGFEAKFSHDEEMAFRVVARRNKLLGHWAAQQMSLTPAEDEAYARSVVQAEFEEMGDEDVVRKLLGDMLAAGVDASETIVRAEVERCAIEARRQLLDVV